VVAELGETIASAHSAVERKNALLSTSVTRLEFAIDDPTFVLSRLARDAECTLAYRGGLQRTSDGRYVFVTVRDAAVDDVVDAATESTAVDDVRRISTGRDGGVVRLELAGPFLAPELADHGVVFREATAEPETTSLAVDVPDGIDVRNVSQLVRRTFAGAELRSKRTLSGTDRRDLRSTVVDRLTDRQLEVVRTAYYSGFFESPRERTGEEIAETLGFSPAAFYRHVRTVQRKLFTALFEERDVPIAAPPERVE
jgi:predicted DNA binding protein